MITTSLGAFASTLRYESLPADVVAAVKLRVLDQLGAALAGYSIGTVNQLLPVMEETGTSTLWGNGRRASKRDAVLFNAFMSHACYMEDGSRYTGGHAASVVIPTAVVLGEHLEASGHDLIVAIAVGYEVFLRLGRAMYPSIVKRGFQSTAVLGGVSAAAACASLLRLSEAQASHAIALATMTAIGFKESVKSTASQPFQVGRAAEGGLTAALLAQNGVEGAVEIIEKGFFRGFTDHVSDLRLDDLGRRFSIGETYLKRHGGCRGNHAPIDVAEALIKQHGVDLDRVRHLAIEVDTVTFAEDIRQPRDGLQAQQSIAYAVAANLVFGDASFRRYTDAALRDPAVRSLMERIEVTTNSALDEGYPDRRPAVVKATLRDGRSLEGRMELAKGEPENPMTTEEVERKFLVLAADQLGTSQSQNLASVIHDLDKVRDSGDIARLMVTA
jgi:2-methylcitrate dehydratase PrpD